MSKRAATINSDYFRARSEPDLNSGCWLWTGPVSEKGYGYMQIRRKKHKAHRVSYETATGVCPGPLLVLHRCDTPACVNPDHLWLGTQAENMRDMVSKGRSSTGETHWNARLNEADIFAIRSSTETSGALGRKLGVSNQTVCKIRARQKWAHVPTPPEIKGGAVVIEIEPGE